MAPSRSLTLILLSTAALALLAGCTGKIIAPANPPLPQETPICDQTERGCDDEVEGDTVCGDGVHQRDDGEVCDGRALGGETCVTLGFEGGALNCAPGCDGFSTGGCEGAGPECGDGRPEGLERCDGDDLRDETCVSLGFGGGALGCDVERCDLDTTMCTVCGDGQVDQGEGCDGEDLGGSSCTALGFDGGALGCTDRCAHDTSGCTFETCGNGEMDGREECEPTLPVEAVCEELLLEGYTHGALTCRDNCTFDRSACATCGDGGLQADERCDGANLGGATCAGQPEGFTGGALACADDCRSFELTACTTCGDGVVEGGEECEDGAAPGVGCGDLGFHSGALGCAGCAFDTSSCAVCGDGVVERDEACDGPLDMPCSDLGPSFGAGQVACTGGCALDTSGCEIITCGNGALDEGEDCEPGMAVSVDCVALGGGYDAGALTCGANCTYDTSACSACGDGQVEGGEVCEAGALGDATCASVPGGFDAGTLACAPDCHGFDTSACTTCGDGEIEGAEVCEGAGVGGATCRTQGYDQGTLGCLPATCRFDTSGCTRCGDGVAAGPEVCDGGDLRGAVCADVHPGFAGAGLACSEACRWDVTDCEVSPDDADGDTVFDALDPDENDPTICGDEDMDGCDDCAVAGFASPLDDGFDPDGDGACELPLDYACMNGAMSASDPFRLEACVLFSLANADRAHFSEESGDAAPLVWSEEIWAVAFAHSVDMCDRGYFAHVNPDGDGPSERAAAAGLPYGLVENIAVNLDPRAAEYAFMNEPTCTGHRGAILDPRAFEVGVGYYGCDRPTSEYRWGQHHHATMNFRRTNAVPRSDFCLAASTHCEIPPDPPTTAICPQNLINFGFCPPAGEGSVEGWGCPDD